MSIWACVYEIEAYETDYQPASRSWTVDLHTAPNWNDCIRLGISGPDGGSTSGSRSYHDVMLDRSMARALGSALIRFGQTGEVEEWA